MKLCIPVAENRGTESEVYGHFGSAPVFAFHDTESGETAFADNATAEHAHGACNPMQALAGQTVDALIVGGIGARAVARLNEQNIKVFRAVEGTLQDVIERHAGETLEEISIEGACTQHGGCNH